MDPEFSFGQWIRKRRNALNLTCEALAERVGYSVAMMRKIENDERRPSPQAAALLAKALEIPADQQEAFLRVSRQERAVDQLASPSRQETFPWQAPSQPNTNLPVSATLLVGRQAELARLADLLQNPACSLVTLVGLGGIGKTRLAVQAAYGQLNRFAHGVFFVPLDPLDSPEKIVSAIANAIHIQFHEAGDVRQQLLHYLREKHMLLVLDNFEHLMEGVCLPAELMQAAPGIKLLVTSRERLNLQGEWVFEVEGLPYPSLAKENGLERAETYGAVQLFLQGALRVDPGFNLNDENREGVVRICQLMRGVPLGIELSAAWVRVLSCRAIANEIETNLDFLKATARDTSERHRSLRAALDHSWNLLSQQEKEIFRRLSVFRGGFRREAAQQVAGANLHAITSLLDKSLLKRVGDDRYDLHELVRQYAAARLESDPQELDHTRDRYTHYFAELLERWFKSLRSPRQLEILGEISTEMDNVLQAWGWMVAQGKIDEIHKSLDCLYHYHEIRGRFQEAEILFGKAAETLQSLQGLSDSDDVESQVVLGTLLTLHAYFNTSLGRYERASALMQRSLALLCPANDPTALANTLTLLSYLHYRLGKFQQAIQSAQESLDLNRTLDNPIGTVYCLIILSYIHLAQGEFERAYALSSESLEVCRNLVGDPHGMVDSLITLSRAADQLGKYDQARRLAQEGLEISRSLNDRWGAAQTLRQLGRISLKLGETEHAQALLRQSISEFKETGDRPLMAKTLIDLGIAMRTSEAYSESKQCFLEALQTSIETQSIDVVLHALVEMSLMVMEAGMFEQALELVTHSLQNPAIDREVKDRAEQIYAQLASQLTVPQIESVQERAQGATLESLAQAILVAG